MNKFISFILFLLEFNSFKKQKKKIFQLNQIYTIMKNFPQTDSILLKLKI